MNGVITLVFKAYDSVKRGRSSFGFKSVTLLSLCLPLSLSACVYHGSVVVVVVVNKKCFSLRDKSIVVGAAIRGQRLTFTQPEEEEESNVCCEDGDMIN